MAIHKELAKAVNAGDTATARALLDGGISLKETTDVWGWPLLHVAALRGRTDMIRLLWERDEAKDTPSLRRALYFAKQSGKADAIEYLLGLGAASSAAEAALFRGDMEAFKAALAADPSLLETLTPEGNRLLHVAANHRLVDAVRILLDAGAAVDPRNAQGETPFFRAISNHAPAIAKLLLARGADINTVTDYGQNALHCAATTGKDDLVELLEKNGISMDFYDLHVAAACGRKDRLQSLMAGNPALVNARDMFGSTPLYWTAAFGRLEAAEFLLAQGADVHIKDKNGRSPLLCASHGKDKAMVDLLVGHGAVDENA